MDKSIKQALIGLVPTFGGPLPAELIELATSLLVQSRSKASLLTEEEIARPYACANLACERLKQSLGLPKIQPRPPCPPRIYQKLYKFLDATLSVGIKRNADACTSNRADLSVTSSPANPKTPTIATVEVGKTRSIEHSFPKSLHPKQNIQPKPASVNKVTRNQVSFLFSSTTELPEWATPAIRRLCQKLDAPLAPHHVLAGLSSILALPPPTELEIKVKYESSFKNIPALIMVVFLAVYARLAAEETPLEVFMYQKVIGFQILNGFAGQGATKNQKRQSKDLETLLLGFRERGWAQMDWFENITPGAGLDLNSDIRDEETTLETRAATLGDSMVNLQGQFGIEKDQLQAGLGTMMQDQLDYLSEKRRLHYQGWKQTTLVRIQELEQSEEMDSSSA